MLVRKIIRQMDLQGEIFAILKAASITDYRVNYEYITIYGGQQMLIWGLKNI